MPQADPNGAWGLSLCSSKEGKFNSHDGDSLEHGPLMWVPVTGIVWVVLTIIRCVAYSVGDDRWIIMWAQRRSHASSRCPSRKPSQGDVAAVQTVVAAQTVASQTKVPWAPSTPTLLHKCVPIASYGSGLPSCLSPIRLFGVCVDHLSGVRDSRGPCYLANSICSKLRVASSWCCQGSCHLLPYTHIIP